MTALLTNNEKIIFKETYEKYGKNAVSNMFSTKASSSQIDSLKQRLKVKTHINYFFDIKKMLNTKEGAYVLGFIWADGHVRKFGNQIIINIIRDDANEIFSVFLKTSDCWRKMDKKNYLRIDKINRKAQSNIIIENKTLHDFLVKMNYLEKSGVSPDNLLGHIKYKNYWLRGYLDGDGSINIRYRKSNVNCQLSFASTINQNWNFLKNITDELNLKSFKIIKRITNNGNSSTYKSESIFESIILLSYIYCNYDDDLIGLNRKFVKYKELSMYKFIRCSKYQ